jgi:hypothetical protein
MPASSPPEVRLRPGWLQRQFDNVDREVAAWSPAMRREAGFVEEQSMSVSDCGGEVEQVLSAATIKFKGRGWYVTDYGKGK